MAVVEPSTDAVGRNRTVDRTTSVGSARERRVDRRRVAESIYQPGWSPNGTLYYVSDRSGWWQLYRRIERVVRSQVSDVTRPPAATEFGRPQWVFGTSTWAFAGPSTLVVSYTRDGQLAPRYRRRRERRADDCATECVHAIGCGERHARRPRPGSATQPDAVVRVDLRRERSRRFACGLGALDPASCRRQRPSSSQRRGTDGARVLLSAAQQGLRGALGRTASARRHQPRRADVGRAATLDLQIQVLDEPRVCGRRRELSRQLRVRPRLPGAAERAMGHRRRRRRHLCGAIPGRQGEGRRRRAVIRGGSAGGYTTLAALTFHPEVFKAGASYYGVSDLEVLEIDTHKFESRYSHSLIGPYPAARAIYRERSPIHAIDRLACPLILFQGLEDKVVPPNQSQMMADAVRAKGLPVAYLAFEGEQHGFRKAETIIRCLEAELYFYGAVFGFTPADPIPPVPIDNLTSPRALSRCDSARRLP